MKDLKVLTIRDLLTISSADYAVGVSPLSLLILGEKFEEATKVYINDLEVSEFIVLSSNRILAQVPDSERSSSINKLAVVADQPSITRSSILQFEVGQGVKVLSGIERTVQLFCKILLQTPGSDKFAPSEGGGLLAQIGRNISRNDSRSLQSSIVGSVGRTRDLILAKQSKVSRIPANERLLTATVEGVAFHPETTTISARVLLSVVSGREAVTNLTF